MKPEDRLAAFIERTSMRLGPTEKSDFVELLRETEKDSWNAGLLCAAKTLEDAMAAQGQLIGLGVDLREEQAWGHCMVFAIKDHLKT